MLALTAGTASTDHNDTDAMFDHPTTLQSDDLGGARAMAGQTVITVQSNQNLEANITGSTFEVGTINSGGVSFSEGALENFSGVGLFNVVTGNNNAVNTSIGVTINLQ